MRVKETLNLGKTKFKMRGNLPVKEVERQNVWAENKVYDATYGITRYQLSTDG